MAKFNKKGATVTTKIKNHEGADAYSVSTELELASMLLTSFVDDKFYESKQGQLKRLAETVDKLSDKEFAGKAALFARHEYGMRSISHALIGELAQKCKGTTWLRPVIRDVVFRPDDAIEILAYHGNTYGKPIPNVIKRGLRDSLKKFDAYQLAKYRKDTHEVKMVDLFNLLHPKPVGADATETYKKLMAGDLKNTKTWEAKVSASGKMEDKAGAKKEAWAEMIDSKRLGYFALIRNLRNIIKDCPEKMDEVLAMIVNEKAIKTSKLLPFRFLSAYKEIEKIASPHSSKVLDALSDALDISCQNIPDLGGTVCVAVDLSGSMTWSKVSKLSSLTMDELGALMGAMLFAKSHDTIVISFASDARVVNLSSRSSVLENAKKILGSNSGGTNGWAVPHLLRTQKAKVDHLCVFTDMQMWDDSGYDRSFQTEMKKYKAEFPGVKLYSFDLTGYGSLQMPEKEIFCLAGFSEKVFDLLKVLDKGMDVLIKTIKEYEVPKAKARKL